MQPPKYQPLTSEQLNTIRNALAVLDQHDAIAAKAQDCGFDCRSQLALSQVLRQRAQKVMQNFGGQISPA